MKYLFCDVETTGLDVNVHGLIQLAGLIEVDGEVKEEFNFKIKPFPGQMVSKSSLDVNGITVEQLKTFDDPNKVYSQFVTILTKYVDKFDKKDKFFFVGYNSQFDDSFIRKFFENNNDSYYGSLIWWPAICMATAACEFFKEERPTFPNFKLATVAKAAGIDVDESNLHDALYDCKITRQLYRKIYLGL